MNPISKNNFSSIEQMTGKFAIDKSSLHKHSSEKDISFHEILCKEQKSHESNSLKFSRHASERLSSRHINLSDSQLERLEFGAKKALEKGIKESLVMVDNIAFIVNIKNNIVITAVNDSDDKIFTNIDGAVII